MRGAFVLVALVTVAHADPRPPLVPAPLSWDMTPETAATALDRAKMSPQHNARHMWISGANGHTVEPEVIFVPHKGWHGDAHWPTVGGRLEDITLSASELDDTAIAAEVAALTRQYGAPDRTADTPYGKQRVWVRGGIWLVVLAGMDTTTHVRAMSIAFRRDDRPLPPLPP